MPKQYRFTYTFLGHELIGKWRAYNLQEIQDNVTAFAENKCAFTLEFQ